MLRAASYCRNAVDICGYPRFTWCPIPPELLLLLPLNYLFIYIFSSTTFSFSSIFLSRPLLSTLANNKAPGYERFRMVPFHALKLCRIGLRGAMCIHDTHYVGRNERCHAKFWNLHKIIFSQGVGTSLYLSLRSGSQSTLCHFENSAQIISIPESFQVGSYR